MNDLESILPVWRELEDAGADYVLATVAAVEGSSYRKPGSCMVLSQEGRRAGTVSGGCLEAEVARRAWWLTSQGPVVEPYSTVADDGERPYGSGCGGVVRLLLERRQTVAPLLVALEAAFAARVPLTVATVLEGPLTGLRAFAGLSPGEMNLPLSRVVADPLQELQKLAEESLAAKESMKRNLPLQGANAAVWADYRPARPGLWVFGAGDDARPLVHLARELGWFVSLADGRSNLATAERFPEADRVTVPAIGALSIGGVSNDLAPALSGIKASDAAIVMTHSFEQDARALAALLALSSPPAYIGVLGPRPRTRELLIEAAGLMGLCDPLERAEMWLQAVHAPTGLDLGADTPASIALSILAEAQQTLAAATGLSLSKVRGERIAPAAQ